MSYNLRSCWLTLLAIKTFYEFFRGLINGMEYTANKRKAIIFGAVEKLPFFIDKNKNLWEFVYICDNNKEKWGQEYCGLTIRPPEEILLSKDVFVFIVSWAFPQIKRQLLLLGINENRLIAPPKQDLMPPIFVDLDVRNTAIEFISTFTSIAQAAGINLLLEAGALLGLVRDSDLIHWDGDIDFSVPNLDATKIYQLINALNLDPVFKWSVTSDLSYSKAGEIFQITGSFCPRGVWSGPKIPFDILTRFDCGEWSTSLSGEIFKLPKILFKESKLIVINKLPVHIPSDPEKYLQIMYGKDWRIPCQSFSYADFYVK